MPEGGVVKDIETVAPDQLDLTDALCPEAFRAGQRGCGVLSRHELVGKDDVSSRFVYTRVRYDNPYGVVIALYLLFREEMLYLGRFYEGKHPDVGLPVIVGDGGFLQGPVIGSGDVDPAFPEQF